MIVYMLLALLRTGHGATSFQIEFKTEKECQTAWKVFQKQFYGKYDGTAICMEVRK